MKRLFTFIAFACLSIACWAQTEVHPSIQSFEIPKNVNKGLMLEKGEYLATLNPMGKITIYQTITGDAIHQINPIGESCMIFSNGDHLMCYTHGRQLFNYDYHTGQNKWSINTENTEPLWCNDEYVILRSRNEPYLYCYSMANGKARWMTTAEVNEGINYIQQTEDNHIFLSTRNQFYKIDLKKGKTYSTMVETQAVSGKRLAGSIAAGIGLVFAEAASMAFLGYAFIPIPGNSIHTNGSMLCTPPMDSFTLADIGSEVLTHNGLHYLSDRNGVYCFSPTMELIWETPLPKKRTSHSHLYMQGDTLVMTNFGFADLGGNSPRNMGRPFVATFRASDGQQLYYHEIADEREAHSQHYLPQGIVLSHSEKELFSVSLADTVVQPVVWNSSKQGRIKKVAIMPHYKMHADSTHFDSLSIALDCVISENGDAYRTSIDAPAKLICPSGYLYQYVYTLDNGLLLLAGGKDKYDCWIIHPDGTPAYHFPDPIRILKINGNAIQYRKDDKPKGKNYIARF